MSKRQWIRRHEKLSQGGQSKFECKKDGKQFNSKREFYEHQKTHKKV